MTAGEIISQCVCPPPVEQGQFEDNEVPGFEASMENIKSPAQQPSDIMKNIPVSDLPVNEAGELIIMDTSMLKQRFLEGKTEVNTTPSTLVSATVEEVFTKQDRLAQHILETLGSSPTFQQEITNALLKLCSVDALKVINMGRGEFMKYCSENQILLGMIQYLARHSPAIPREIHECVADAIIAAVLKIKEVHHFPGYEISRSSKIDNYDVFRVDNKTGEKIFEHTATPAEIAPLLEAEKRQPMMGGNPQLPNDDELMLDDDEDYNSSGSSPSEDAAAPLASNPMSSEVSPAPEPSACPVPEPLGSEVKPVPEPVGSEVEPLACPVAEPLTCPAA